MRCRICLIAMSLTALLALAPETASQQVPRVARVGMLCPVECAGPVFSAFDDELLKLGWVEGQNLIIERRAAESRFERLPELAAELVRLKPDVMFATSPQPARAADNATSEILVVFSFVADPVRVGLVKSLA